VARSVSPSPRPPVAPPLPAALARATVDSILDPVVVVGPDGSVLHLNPSAEEFFGRSRDRAAGQPLRSLPGGEALSEATVKLHAGQQRLVATGEGNGPVNALDHALRLALLPVYPELSTLELIDFKVRILDAAHGTDAVTRVLIETRDSSSSWVTVGVGANIVEASWQALCDGLVYGLGRQGVTRR